MKARRRAKILQERAWKAVDNGNLDLAAKQLRQALADVQENPTLWNDYGVILQQAGDHDEAEKALKNAVLIAPDYADAYANLASLAARHGRSVQAERIQRKAVEHDPGSQLFRQQLEAYRALMPEGLLATDGEEAPPSETVGIAGDLDIAAFPRLEHYDWSVVEAELLSQGCSVLEKLLTERECAELIELFPREERFEKTVVLDGSFGGGGSYRFFRRPLPWCVHQLRDGVYARLAPVANRVQVLLDRTVRWPPTHEEFLAECTAAGQQRTTPILLRYQAPAENALHQDVWGRVYFPFQLAVTLSPRATRDRRGFEGGSFILADGADGRKSRRLEIPTSMGDAVVFCTRERLTRFGDSYALHGVRHGMAPLTAGERYVVGIPFHDYK